MNKGFRAYYPQNIPFWNTDYFELKIPKGEQT